MRERINKFLLGGLNKFRSLFRWQMEYIARLDFRWKQQLEVEQKEAETTHTANKLLLQNILPLHVGEWLLSNDISVGLEAGVVW